MAPPPPARDYKDTLNLPQTSFEMRANAVQREPQLQAFWEEQQIYARLAEDNPGEVFILHDGPPYANGDIHMGTTLNKILKDIINKYRLLRGNKVRYVPGWDCHGLPIELKALNETRAGQLLGKRARPLELRALAKNFALEALDRQRKSFLRLGVWGDWQHPYLTMTPEYEAAQIHVFGQMALKGYIYRGLKPVHWSPSSRTALAEAELEYPEGHTSPSVYVAFPMTGLTDLARPAVGDALPDLAIWTTTPWTLPGNLAISVHPQLTYAVVKPEAGRPLVVALDLVERLQAILGQTLTVQTTFPGKLLEHCTYRHPLFDREGIITLGEHVTTESGTGLVHTAPGHGSDDYLVGQRYGLEILSPVDDEGKFTEAAGRFSGLFVLKEGNAAIIDALTETGALLKHEPYIHKYPYDWRTKQPTIFRATAQWFASVSGFRDQALRAIHEEVTWIPPQGENRITGMVAERSDWCISRQRVWGLPIPVFYDEATDEPLLTPETIAHVQAIVREQGSDAWWELPVSDLLPPRYRDNGHTYRKGTDTMDVWFDSGSSWAAVLGQRPGLHYPANLYLEGSDQHRGWFQSSLLTSVAVNSHAPYRQVLTHGFVLDEQGRKMSKSLGNVVDPLTVIEGGKNLQQEPAYGADVLRLWVSSVNYADDVPLGKTILKQMADVYRKIRNTARFLLGNLYDFDPQQHSIPTKNLPDLDRYMLHRLGEVMDEITDAFESYQFYRFFQTIQNLCVVDLSNFYLDVAKDRLYISATDSFRRRSCQTVMAIVVENLAKAIAPVLSHLAEDIWQALPYTKPQPSVFQAGWVAMASRPADPALVTQAEALRQLRDDVNKVLEAARTAKTLGSSLEAQVNLYVPDPELRHALAKLNPPALEGNGVDELRYWLLVSQVTLAESPAELEGAAHGLETDRWHLGVRVAAGRKCGRCWNYSEQVGTNETHGDLCERCTRALEGGF
ncbi:MAG: isoleucine--tRNA ligase [Gloeomargaritaceae cyanobacterium C42_A2020_066]|nr:isoleucine--tRNA ligase [Gloeomargaritaceae cyanobacterium C42_A2020_066]